MGQSREVHTRYMRERREREIVMKRKREEAKEANPRPLRRLRHPVVESDTEDVLRLVPETDTENTQPLTDAHGHMRLGSSTMSSLFTDRFNTLSGLAASIGERTRGAARSQEAGPSGVIPRVVRHPVIPRRRAQPLATSPGHARRKGDFEPGLVGVVLTNSEPEKHLDFARVEPRLVSATHRGGYNRKCHKLRATAERGRFLEKDHAHIVCMLDLPTNIGKKNTQAARCAFLEFMGWKPKDIPKGVRVHVTRPINGKLGTFRGQIGYMGIRREMSRGSG